MALFFDKEWFDKRLADAQLSRTDLADVLGIDETALAEIWKDQRELSAQDVVVIAALFDAMPEDVAHHAGISTPVPKPTPSPFGLRDLLARLELAEQQIAELRVQLRELRRER